MNAPSPRTSGSPRPASSKVLFAALALALVAPASAAEKPEGKAVKHEGYSATYPTGLRLVTYELPGAPRASVGVSWLAGSVDDPPGREGLAHVVEHLAFRCRVAGGSVWQRLQADGVAFNAFTVHDATVYFETGKPDQLRSLVSLEIERMKDPLAGVTQADVDLEKEIVVSELRERDQGYPEGAAYEALEARLYGAGHPYHRSVGGTEASVRSITMADVTSFAARLYRPERAILTLITPRPAKEAARLAFDRLGTLATGPTEVLPKTTLPATRPPPPMPPDPPAELQVLKGSVPRPILLVAFSVPGEAAEGAGMASAAARGLEQVLLMRLLGYGEWDKVAGINAFYINHDGPGTLVARIELEDGIDPAKVLAALRDNLVTPNDDGADTRARSKVALQHRDELLMALYLSLENLDVGDLSEYQRATGKPDAITGRLQQVLAINQSLEDYWHRYLKRARSAAVVLLPDPDRPARLEVGGGLASRTAEEHADRDSPFTPRRPAAEVAIAPGLDQALRATLPNGLKVVMIRRPLLPIVEAELVVRTDLGGRDGASTALPNFAMSFSGTAADARWSHSERLGAQGSTRVDLESVTFLRRGTATTLPQLLEDMQRLTGNFEYGRTRTTIIRDRIRKNLEAALRTPDGVATSAFFQALYPDHPYGRTPKPTEVEALTSDDAERWAKAQLRPDEAVLVVTGDIEPGPALLAKITSTFGGWKAGRVAARAAPLAPLPREPRVLLLDRPGAKLAQLLVGFRLPEAARGDEVAVAAVARRLGQTLNETLRVNAGATYGVHPVVLDRPLAGALVIQTGVDAGVAGDSLVRLLAGVEAMAQAPLPAEANDRLRWLVARDFGLRFDTVSQVSAAMKTVAVRGLPNDHWEKEAASVAALTPARIQATARALLGREIIMVIGDARVVGPQLKEAGFDYEPVKGTP
jgi:zinc protease